ncbi:MAG: aldo/keto reductase [Candidatus Dormibacteraceae bacterium]
MAIATLPFGRTGHQSTRILFGAAALSDVTQDAADRALEAYTRHGGNHIDVAASYGEAEVRIRPFLQDHRQDVFLATKTGARTRDAARAELERSLTRMGVKSVDLWQLHNLADPIDWDRALSRGGALEAAQEAREEGLTRFIGVTGHGLQIAGTHRRSLERFDFDSVLLPYNYLTMQIPYYAENFTALERTCQERGTAMQTIKSLAVRHWGDRERTATVWYEPLTDQPAIDTAIWWALGRPGIFLNSAGDVDLLPKILDAAARFERGAADKEISDLLERAHAAPLFV